MTDDLSSLSAPYDVTPEGVDEMLPEGSTHLIEDIAAAQMRAGGMPLEHPRARYTHGGNRIVSSGNTLLVGPRVGSWDRRLPGFACQGKMCDSKPPETPFSTSLDFLTTEPKVVSKVLAKNGISLLQFSLREDWDIEEYYGYSVYDGLTLMSAVAVGETFVEFGESTSKATDSTGEFATYNHAVGGFVAGKSPAGNATYRGIMAGSVVEKDDTVELNVPEWVIGDADLSFDLAALEMDATFSNIVALESGDTFADLEWTGVPVYDEGIFEQVLATSENYIGGAFFGEGQEGVAGVFEQNSIHGTFSAMDPTANVKPGLTDVDSYTIKNLSQARTAAGGTVPAFTVEEYAEAATEIFEEANIFFAGHRIASWTRDLPHYDCKGRVCIYDDGEGVFEDPLDAYTVDAGGHDALMNKNGIDVVQFAIAYEYGEGLGSGSNLRYGLGLWGEDNIAWTFFDHGYEDGRYSYYESRIAGDSAGSNPSGDATYTGVMAGSVVEKDSAVPLNTPDWVMGDAELTFRLADDALGAAFTNIVSLASGTPHDDLNWEDVSVMDGAFDHGGTGDYLKGAFFDDEHEEIAGAFEQDSIAGVFSARQ